MAYLDWKVCRLHHYFHHADADVDVDVDVVATADPDFDPAVDDIALC